MKQNVTVAITVYGKVQGVGFRPLVCRLAGSFGITGFVRNAGTHVDIIATGCVDNIQNLCDGLRHAASPVRVDRICCEKIETQAFDIFVSKESTDSEETKCVGADIGICNHCLQELKEKGNRRESYPYISCAQCGPRYTIIRKLPYDRANTTMDLFPLCDECTKEYRDMQNRRGHGETISCYHCGPQLQCFLKEDFAENTTEKSGGSPEPFDRIARVKNLIASARDLLTNGQIIMVKAAGGFNLVCRADQADVVLRLRDLKKRMSKPFAVMVKDVALAETFCCLSAVEKALLQSQARPIVLCQKKKDAAIRLAENVTDVSDQAGVFLPSMGFYACLETAFPLVVTSCNYTGRPIIYQDGEARLFFEEHKNVAALFTYDREILRPADDAVTRIVNSKVQIFRRTKGYMPEAVASVTLRGSVLAAGAQMEPGFCLTSDGTFFPAEIPGDITLEKTERFFADSVEDWTELLNIKPQAVVADLHPGYASTQWGNRFAEQNGLPFYQVQHHHAHALAVIAEHDLQGKTLAVCFDGTGLGTDGTVWGGEFMLCEGAEFYRAGHVKTISMLGGDISMQQAWKTALCHLAAAGIENDDPRLTVVKKALKQKINCIGTSSMGRLFDAAAGLLGLADFNSHQGRCAMALEAAARRALQNNIAPLPVQFKKEADNIYDPAPIWIRVCDLQFQKMDTALHDKNKIINTNGIVTEISQNETSNAAADNTYISAAALGFHNAVTGMVADMAESCGVTQIALCGGCFANRILLESCESELQKRGFAVYYNQKVSCGDGGISLGQAYYGLLKINEESL